MKHRKGFKHALKRLFGPAEVAGSELAQLRARAAVGQELADACKLVVAVKQCMMFDHIHADFMVKEVLAEHQAKSVQMLAKDAEDAAERALKKWEVLAHGHQGGDV
jgi:hypothetical protein